MFPLKDNIPTRRFPVLTVAIIVANIVMYLWFQEALERGLFAGPDEGNVIKYGAIPYEISNPGEQCVPVSPEALSCAEEAAVEREAGA